MQHGEAVMGVWTECCGGGTEEGTPSAGLCHQEISEEAHLYLNFSEPVLSFQRVLPQEIMRT